MESKWQGACGIAGIERDQRRRPRRRWKWRSDTEDERRGWGGVERWGEAADGLHRLAGRLFIAGRRHPSRAPPTESGHGSAGRGSHGDAWEIDEEGANERQGVTETIKALGQ